MRPNIVISPAGLRLRGETDDMLERHTKIGTARLYVSSHDPSWCCVLCFESGCSLVTMYPAIQIGRALATVLAERKAHIQTRAVFIKGVVEIAFQRTQAGCAK
jgi:hypothetical protein